MDKIDLIKLILKIGNEKTTINECESKFEIGKPYMIQTVTAFYKGILLSVDEKEFVLNDCSWVADTGRFNEFVNDDSNVEEEEPFAKETKVIIGRGALICAYKIPSLIRKLK